MAFFARPLLDNTQFKQLVNSELTLSGQTQIATVSGLTLTDGIGGYVPIIATGGSNNYVLTYDDSGVSPVIRLKEATASGGTGVYDCASPTTCTVGGLPAGTTIYNCPINDILQCILVPTLNPTLTNPSISSFTINPTPLVYEVGSTPTISGIVNFNAGCINPQYTSACDKRSNGTQCYDYLVKGIPYTCVTNSISNTYPFGTVNIDAGNNVISATVYYCSGVQPKDSAGNNYCTPLSAGATSPSQKTICGLYPWFWGIESSGGAAAGVNRPTSACIQSLITGGTACKCVGNSSGTLYVNFNSTADDYLWFAIPNASTNKCVWYETALNNGAIGGVVSVGGNLFPNYEPVYNVCSSSPIWGSQTYKVYVSNYQSASNTLMELRNN